MMHGSNSMETSQTGSYVALKLSEIQQRFAELKDKDLAGLSLEEDADEQSSLSDDCNPYNRS